MKKEINLVEEVTYNHSIEIEADTEEQLEELEELIGCALESDEIESKEEIFNIITSKGAKYSFIRDGSPDVELTYM